MSSSDDDGDGGSSTGGRCVGFLAMGVCSISVEEDVAFFECSEDGDEISLCPKELSLARIPNGVDPRPIEGETRVFKRARVRPETVSVEGSPNDTPDGGLGDIGLDSPGISCKPRKSSWYLACTLYSK
jgi:hypothetical protein